MAHHVTHLEDMNQLSGRNHQLWQTQPQPQPRSGTPFVTQGWVSGHVATRPLVQTWLATSNHAARAMFPSIIYYVEIWKPSTEHTKKMLLFKESTEKFLLERDLQRLSGPTPRPCFSLASVVTWSNRLSPNRFQRREEWARSSFWR